jgi:hypothetical protein
LRSDQRGGDKMTNIVEKADTIRVETILGDREAKEHLQECINFCRTNWVSLDYKGKAGASWHYKVEKPSMFGDDHDAKFIFIFHKCPNLAMIFKLKFN